MHAKCCARVTTSIGYLNTHKNELLNYEDFEDYQFHRMKVVTGKVEVNTDEKLISKFNVGNKNISYVRFDILLSLTFLIFYSF